MNKNVTRIGCLTDNNAQGTRIYKTDGAACSLCSNGGGYGGTGVGLYLVKEENDMINKEDLEIRKLCPQECFRLMDISDNAFKKAEAVNSNTQLYKEAGNAIVVNCLVGIFGQMFPGHENDYKKLDNIRSFN